MALFFEIGFGRTGTRSLLRAMEALGFSTWTGSRKKSKATYDDMYDKVWDGQFDWDAIQQFDYIGSVAMPFYVPLAVEYPDNKFILTRRNERQWFVSQRLRAKINPPKKDIPGHRVFLRMAMFGCPIFNRDQWLERYKQHNANVIDYFASQPDRLLVLDVESSNEEKWEKLEAFTGRQRPTDTPWPWIRRHQKDLNNPAKQV